MTWCDGRMCAFDIETTGTDVETARIVTAAVAYVGGGGPTHEWTILADPGVEIPDEAAAVHGITTERARAEGVPAAMAIEALLSQLDRREGSWPIVAMNARFDLTIADREARRHGLAPLSERGPLWVFDPFVADKWLDRFRRGSRKLDALCEHYQVTLDTAHDAASDAVAAARLAWVIGKRGQVVRRVRNAKDGRELALLRREWDAVRHDLPKLHAAQIRWAADQARGLAEYFTRQGNPQHVAPEWPLIPVEGAIAA